MSDPFPAGARKGVSVREGGTVHLGEKDAARLLAGRRILPVKAGKPEKSDPPANPLHELPAYKAGVAQAVLDRRTAVVELQETLQTLEPGAPGYEFARHQVARFRQLDQQEGTPS